jgi:hypothetical protein
VAKPKKKTSWIQDLRELLRSLPERDGLPDPIECEPMGGVSILWTFDGRAVEVEARRDRTIVRMLGPGRSRPINLVVRPKEFGGEPENSYRCDVLSLVRGAIDWMQGRSRPTGVWHDESAPEPGGVA